MDSILCPPSTLSTRWLRWRKNCVHVHHRPRGRWMPRGATSTCQLCVAANWAVLSFRGASPTGCFHRPRFGRRGFTSAGCIQPVDSTGRGVVVELKPGTQLTKWVAPKKISRDAPGPAAPVPGWPQTRENDKLPRKPSELLFYKAQKTFEKKLIFSGFSTKKSDFFILCICSDFGYFCLDKAIFWY